MILSKLRRFLLLAIIVTVTFTSCSKKSDITPANTVKINGNLYSTVKIGSQTWTSINYNGAGGANYNNSATNDAAYGKLYTLAEAKVISLPAGWRLPSADDYTTLMGTLGATDKISNDGGYLNTSSAALAAMSATGWNMGGGTNSSGFNAVAAGYYFYSSTGPAFSAIGTDAMFLTSSNSVNSDPISLNIHQVYSVYAIPSSNIIHTSTDRASIRFVTDN
jgi:uncharacterized protein (TIGR02145 family)